MSEIIYQTPNITNNCGILHITEGQPCNIPFVFTIRSKNLDGSVNEYTIQNNDVVEFIIKSDIKLLTPTIWKRYNNVKNNVSVLSLNSQDMKSLLGSKTYYMSAILHKASTNRPTVLIRKLDIYVQEVV
jgi:hypothetical protein